MYSFLIVDDERHIRETVSNIISKINSDKVYLADNGASALRIIEQKEIDAIILDIKMPDMDGISLLKELRNRAQTRNIVVAILSGYDEFEYAKQVMSFDVIDYILKPVNRNELIKVYYKIVRKIKNRVLLDKEIEDLIQRLNEIKPLIKQRFFYDLIYNDISSDYFEEQRAFLNLCIKNRPTRVALIQIDTMESDLLNHKKDNRVKIFRVMDIISGIVSNWLYCDSFIISNNMIALLWCPSNVEQDLSYLKENIELLINEMFELYKITLNAGIGVVVPSPLKAKESYESALEILKNKLLFGSGQVFDVYNKPDQCENTQLDLKTDDIIEKIWLNQPSEALDLLSAYLDQIRKDPNKYKVIYIQLFFNKLLIECLYILEKECGNLEEFNKRLEINPFNIKFGDLSIDEVSSIFTDLITNVCEEISNIRNKNNKNLVFKAKEIIMQKYNTDINVENIAKELHYSKNYFGQLFKAETGMSVNEFINIYRIQKAKELLAKDKYYIYEIAKLVGFDDQQYFTRVFKKIVGVSPSEYRV